MTHAIQASIQSSIIVVALLIRPYLSQNGPFLELNGRWMEWPVGASHHMHTQIIRNSYAMFRRACCEIRRGRQWKCHWLLNAVFAHARTFGPVWAGSELTPMS